ncbi:MAG: DUF131 domain-containing protein [Candidatus Aenigmarchaeota archaeon]|nr:DUF131 domain-containing protein [Candidatus Aenigmarchaeota archaeon]MCX8190828.1 DUF131 domain-containing protein [Candidatus Aenigmarchaeota archaeon]MDW8160077.1 DUF131 domain-containing protein [Candidatus Aenigmarchaeota archaeon]
MRRRIRKMYETLGISLIVFSMLLFFIGLILLLVGKQKTKIEGGGVVLIGPIPIVFGTSYQIVIILLILTLTLLLIFFILNLKIFRLI